MATTEWHPLHGGQLREIAERFRIPVSELLDFSANINPDGPPPSVMPALRKSLDSLATLTEYPDLHLSDLKHKIACNAETRAETLMVANGFVPLLEATLRTLNIRSCLLPVPAFVEYRKALERAEIDITLHALEARTNFNYDPAAMFDGQHDAILLANPQNPSGVCHIAAQMRALVARAAEKRMVVLLDEAFIDYAPDCSLTSATAEFPNLIVFRSVTKFHGLPGLRVAYAVADAARAESVNRNLAPWPVTTLASHAVSAALDDGAYAVHSRADNIARRTELESDLQSLGLTVYPSAANFLLFRLPSAVDPSEFWRRMIVLHRIVLRACANYEALPQGHFRAAVRTREENARLAAAIAESLASDAVLRSADAELA